VTLSELIKKVEAKLGTKTKVLLGLMAATSLGSSLFLGTNKENKNINAATVMITRLDGRSGGSGVVIATKDSESTILTNGHVCHVIENGGTVTTTEGEMHTVKAYKKDVFHDLCLIKVAAKLKNRTNIAKQAPKLYEEATISGHPSLLPNVVTSGHFAGNKVITVFTGITPCTKEELESMPEICFFFRGIPVVKTYETTLVTALIMAGSSGSAVYNSNKEISGLVFAGSGDLSFAFTVPFDYVRSFVDLDDGNNYEKPNYQLDIMTILSGMDKKIERKELIQRCTSSTLRGKVKEFCNIIINDVVW